MSYTANQIQKDVKESKIIEYMNNDTVIEFNNMKGIIREVYEQTEKCLIECGLTTKVVNWSNIEKAK